MKVDDLYKVALMLLDLALEENTQVTRLDTASDDQCLLFSQAAVHGIVVIYDIGGVTTSHTLMMTPAIMKKHVVVFQVGEKKIVILTSELSVKLVSDRKTP